jgi:hypothetical protein
LNAYLTPSLCCLYIAARTTLESANESWASFWKEKLEIGEDTDKMPTLAVTNFNIVCSVLGGFITLFGLVSYLFKEKFYLSEACKTPQSGSYLGLQLISGIQ